MIATPESEQSQRIYHLDLVHLWNWIKGNELDYKDMDELDALAYKKHLQESFAKATAQRMLSVARLFFAKLKKKGLIDFDPLFDLKTFTLDNESSHKALTKDEVIRLLNSIDISSPKGKRDYAIISLLIRTGLRRSECVALNIGDISKEQGHNIAVVHHGKGDKRRKIKIPVDVFRILEDYMSGREYTSLESPLFIGFDRRPKYTATRISDKVVERIIEGYGKKIGFGESNPLTPHDLRSTFITLALEGNASLTQVQYAAGHADPRTTERYQKRKLNLDDNAVDYIHL